jgi:hypothetical protein
VTPWWSFTRHTLAPINWPSLMVPSLSYDMLRFVLSHTLLAHALPSPSHGSSIARISPLSFKKKPPTPKSMKKMLDQGQSRFEPLGRYKVSMTAHLEITCSQLLRLSPSSRHHTNHPTSPLTPATTRKLSHISCLTSLTCPLLACAVTVPRDRSSK